MHRWVELLKQGVLQRGMSITNIIKKENDAESPEMLQQKDVLARKHDDEAIDELFSKAREMKR